MCKQKINEVKPKLLCNPLLLVNSAVGRAGGFLESLMWLIYKNTVLIPEGGGKPPARVHWLPPPWVAIVPGARAGVRGMHVEQGDFVPISKNLTTQLGRTAGNNYNKAEKEI